MKQIEKREQLIVRADLESQMASLKMLVGGDQKLVEWLNSQYDPTVNKADYTQWIVNQYRKIGGLPTNIKELLKEFDRLKKIGELKGKFSTDIGSYKTIEELRKAIAQYQGFVSKKQQKKRNLEGVMMNLEEWGEVQYASLGYILLTIDDPKYISKFLRTLGITAWCLQHENYAADYAPITFLIKNGKVVANLAGSEESIYDRDDEISDTIEHYEVLIGSGFEVILDDANKYSRFPDTLQKRIREHAARDTKRAYYFAAYIIKDRFPEAELEIAKSDIYSYLYSYNVTGERFLEGEKAILEGRRYIAEYTNNVIKGRWPEAESIVLENPKWALDYSSNILKRPWPEAEKIIATSSSASYYYAATVLHARFPEGEEAIAISSDYSYRYALDVLKGPFPKGEKAILLDIMDSIKYVHDVIKGRWPELETMLIAESAIGDYWRSDYWRSYYENMFDLYLSKELRKFLPRVKMKSEETPGETSKPEKTDSYSAPMTESGIIEGEVGPPVNASFRPLESLIMMADLESQMPALLKITNDKDFILDLNKRYDPTGMKADYTQWLVKQHKKNGPLPVTIGLMLKEFNRLKKIPALKGELNPDINSYKTPEALGGTLSQFANVKSKKEHRRTTVQGVMVKLDKYGVPTFKAGGYILLHCDDPDKISEFLKVLNIDAWCIKDYDYAADYAPITFLIKNGKVVANLADSEKSIYDRQDEISDVPEHYELLLREGYDVMIDDVFIYSSLSREMKKKVREIASKDAHRAYKFSRYVIKVPFPEGEKAIATSSNYSYRYATDVLEGPFPEGEKAILSNIWDSIKYARDVLKGRWPELEKDILQSDSSHDASNYAGEVIKGRWPEAESLIAKHSGSSTEYATDVLKGPFPEGEAAIAMNDWDSFEYAKNALNGRFEKGEEVISRDGYISYKYAKEVLRSRFIEGEKEISMSSADSLYANQFKLIWNWSKDTYEEQSSKKDDIKDDIEERFGGEVSASYKTWVEIFKEASNEL